MTYLQFHLLFTLPPILLLAVLAVRDVRRGMVFSGPLQRGVRFSLLALLAHVGIAFFYTTPWDNYLIASGVWHYGVDRVMGVIGYVPVEEYLFFCLQTILTGLFLFHLGRRGDTPSVPLAAHHNVWIRLLGTLAWLGFAALGVLALRHTRGTYFGLIGVWAGPVLALQWGFGGDIIIRRIRLVLPVVLIPTFYLWITDRIALGAGIWWINPELSSGFNPYGLPVEEALFFLVTNLLIGFGLTLACDPASRVRLRELKRVRWWHAVLGLWALSMIPTPLFPESFVPLAYLSTALLALGVLGYALERYGRVSLKLFALACSFGVLVERFGTLTGVPFGAYQYTTAGPSLLGIPLFVPLGWWAFSMISLTLSPSRGRVVLAPAALVAWDLGLDPLMVNRGAWAFTQGGAYYGVPVSNFIGWYIAGMLLMALMMRLEPRLRLHTDPELRLIYLLQAFLMSVGLTLFGLLGAALVTLFAMGLLSLPAWRSPELRALLGRS